MRPLWNAPFGRACTLDRRHAAEGVDERRDTGQAAHGGLERVPRRDFIDEQRAQLLARAFLEDGNELHDDVRAPRGRAAKPVRVLDPGFGITFEPAAISRSIAQFEQHFRLSGGRPGAHARSLPVIVAGDLSTSSSHHEREAAFHRG
jgi:hypothetical protein